MVVQRACEHRSPVVQDPGHEVQKSSWTGLAESSRTWASIVLEWCFGLRDSVSFVPVTFFTICLPHSKKVASTLFASEAPLSSSSSRRSRAKTFLFLELEGGSILSMSPANHGNNRPRRPRFSWKWPCHSHSHKPLRHIEIWRQNQRKEGPSTA